jgi:hypothetical protein
MKNKQIGPTNDREKTLKTVHEPAPRLSDDAFYLIAMASLLKKMIKPYSMRQFLTPGNNVKFNYGAGE